MDGARFLASFGVVLIHACADVIAMYGKVPLFDWWVVNGMDSLIRACVPLFFMLSGALLLASPDQPLAEFFKKRMNRILIPFLFWAVVYLAWKKYFLGFNFSWSEIFSMIAKNQVHFHFWFFYALIGLYLLTPLFRVFVHQARPALVWYFIGLWFVLASLWPFVQTALRLFWSIKLDFYLPVNGAQGFIGYFLLGYALWKGLPERVEKAAPWAAFAAWLFCAFGTYAVSIKTGYYNVLFYENLSPGGVIYASAVFLILKRRAAWFDGLAPRSKGILSQLSQASLGVYIIHPIILYIAEKGHFGMMLSPFLNPRVGVVLLSAVFTYLLSLAVAMLFLKLPLLRRTV